MFRIDTPTKVCALEQIATLNHEIVGSGGKTLSLGAYAKKTLTEYPRLRWTHLRHQILVNKLTALRDALRLAALGHVDRHVSNELDRLLDT
jgi:hypothetical protein